MLISHLSLRKQLLNWEYSQATFCLLLLHTTGFTRNIQHCFIDLKFLTYMTFMVHGLIFIQCCFLVLAVFIHVDLIHLFNLWILFHFIDPFVEKQLGCFH